MLTPTLMTPEHYRHMEQVYLKAPINKFYNLTIEVSEAQAAISMVVKEHHFHLGGSMHGAMYFKMLDDAAFFAVASIVPDNFILTASFDVHFLKPVTEGRIGAVGTVKYRSKSTFIAHATLYDQEQQEVAIGTGTFRRSKMPWPKV